MLRGFPLPPVRIRAVAGAVLLTAGLPAPAAQYRHPAVFELTGLLPSAIRESSGVAASRGHAGVLWTHNDSGDGPFLYAISAQGHLLGVHRVAGARAVDWEDIGSGPCPTRPGNCLFIGDVGDNNESRRVVTIYVVQEPDTIESLADGTPRPTAMAAALALAYPDRPHDTEALWVNPDGSLDLVTKGVTGPIVRYRVPPGAFWQAATTVEALGVVPIIPQRALGRWVTGAAISPHRSRVAIRTYSELYVFRFMGSELRPDGPPCWLGTREPQGEAVDFVDDSTLVLTSEARRGWAGQIHLVRC